MAWGVHVTTEEDRNEESRASADAPAPALKGAGGALRQGMRAASRRGRSPGNSFSCGPCRRNQPCRALDLSLVKPVPAVASGAVGEETCLVGRH